MKSNALSRSTTKTRFIVNCGLLIAISVVLKIVFEVYIPLGGFPSLRLNLTSIPIFLSGIIFGPLAGFIVGVISDLLCFAIKPGGPFFFGFTLVSGLTGLIPGCLIYLLKRYPFKHLEWFNLGLIAILGGILFYFKVFQINNHALLFNDAPLNPIIFCLFIILLAGFIVFPIIIVRHSDLDSKIRPDHLLFIISVTQLLTSIVLNTWFLSMLYGQAISVLLPARIITNIFLIPLYTICLGGLIKTIPDFIKSFN